MSPEVCHLVLIIPVLFENGLYLKSILKESQLETEYSSTDRYEAQI